MHSVADATYFYGRTVDGSSVTVPHHTRVAAPVCNVVHSLFDGSKSTTGMPREYRAIIWDVAYGRPTDGAAFSIMQSSHCACKADACATPGSEFVDKHGYALGLAVANQGSSCGVKLLHWGGANGKAYHASVVGPYDHSLRCFVDEQLELRNLLQYSQVIYFDLHEIPTEEE